MNKNVITTKKGEQFSILSYNVCFGNCVVKNCPRGKLIYEAIKESNSDIVCLQETHDKMEKEMRNIFKKDYKYFKFNSPTNYLAAGCGVMSKYPFEEVVFEYPREKRKGKKFKSIIEGVIFRQQVLLFTLPSGKKIIVSNFHLRPATALGNKSSVGDHIKAYFKESVTVRLKEFMYFWNRINTLEELKDVQLKLFVGDFNEGKYGKAIKFLKREKYKDAIKNETTWYWPVKFFNLWGSFDHIFYQPSQMKLLKYKTHKGKYKLISDHCPIDATFEIL